MPRLLSYWGAEIWDFPVICTDTLHDYSDLKFKLNNLDQYMYLIFTNAVSIDYFIAHVLGEFTSLDCMKGKQIITSGWSIAKKLLDYGVDIDFVANDHSLDTVLDKLKQIMSINDRALLISGRMTGNSINVKIKEKLKNYNLNIDIVDVFSINFSDIDKKDIQELPEFIDLIIVTDFLRLIAYII